MAGVSIRIVTSHFVALWNRVMTGPHHVEGDLGFGDPSAGLVVHLATNQHILAWDMAATLQGQHCRQRAVCTPQTTQVLGPHLTPGIL